MEESKFNPWICLVCGDHFPNKFHLASHIQSDDHELTEEEIKTFKEACNEIGVMLRRGIGING